MAQLVFNPITKQYRESSHKINEVGIWKGYQETLTQAFGEW